MRVSHFYSVFSSCFLQTHEKAFTRLQTHLVFDAYELFSLLEEIKAAFSDVSKVSTLVVLVCFLFRPSVPGSVTVYQKSFLRMQLTIVQ